MYAAYYLSDHVPKLYLFWYSVGDLTAWHSTDDSTTAPNFDTCETILTDASEICSTVSSMLIGSTVFWRSSPRVEAVSCLLPAVLYSPFKQMTGRVVTRLDYHLQNESIWISVGDAILTSCCVHEFYTIKQAASNNLIVQSSGSSRDVSFNI